MNRRDVLRTLPAAAAAGLISGCAGGDDADRFPPYDNTDEVTAFYKSKPEFFRFLTPADLPADLKWETGLEHPDLGSPDAKKGGTIRWFTTSFPPCLRWFGPDANSSFRSEHYDDIAVKQVEFHPNFPSFYIPGVCDRWAVGPSGDVAYYHIDPAARFSNGRPVTAADYFMLFYIQLSPYAQDPYTQNYFSQKFKGIDRYDDLTFAMRLAEPRPDPIFFTLAPPMDHVHYREFGPDFPQRYQWRHEPTTGAYEIRPEDIRIGSSITMRRVRDWWAGDRKYYRNRYNVDAVQYQVIQNPEKAFEAFKAGRIDFYHTYLDRQPQVWHEKMDEPAFHNGWMERAQFYNDFPRPSTGIHFNCSKPFLTDVKVRRGLAYSLNMQRVIDVELKGDLDRLRTVNDGFGRFTHPMLRPTEFSRDKARAAFAEAGFTERDEKGILRNPTTGQRVSVELSIRSRPNERRYALRLKEEALKCGVELRVEELDDTAQFKKALQKEHELIMCGWVHVPLYPRYWEGYHSDNAYEKAPDGTRKIKTNTNNISEIADPELDALIYKHERAKTLDELQTLGHRIEEVIRDRACFVPSWSSSWHRCVYWRWVRWPDDYNIRLSEHPAQHHVHWVDENRRQETREAMHSGQTFPVRDLVFDQYRERVPAAS